MSSQDTGYHVGYETTKAYQTEMRAIRAQDRAARQIRAAQPHRPNLRLIAHLRRGLWAMIRRREARPEVATPRDLPTALPSKHQ
jgi:hypothetical protein